MAEQRRGNTSRCLAAAEDAARLAESAHAVPWDLKFPLLVAELRMSRGEDAAKLPVIAREPPSGKLYDGVRARREYLLGRLAYSKRNLEVAMTTARQAEAMATAASEPDIALDSALLQGVCLARQQKYREAEVVFARVLDASERARDNFHRSGAMLNLGFNRLGQSRYDEALPYFESAVRDTGPDTATLHSVALNNLAICYSRLGEFDRAAAAQKEAIAIQEKAEARPYLQQTLAETGNNLILAGKPGEGLQYLERALKLARQLNDIPQAAMWAGNLAAAYIGIGDWSKAAEFNERAVSLKQQAPGADTLPNTLNAALIAAGRGQRQVAESLFAKCLAASKSQPAILWESHAGLGELYADSKPEPAGKHFEAALAIIERTQSDLLKPEYKISYLSRLIHFYQVYVDALCRRGQWEKALRIADSSRARVLAERSTGVRAGVMSNEELHRIAKQSGPLLYYWLAPERSYAWVVSVKGIKGVQLAPAAEIEKCVAAWRAVVDDTLVDPLSSVIPAAAALRDVILKPVAQWLPKSGPLAVLADGALNSVNFDTLPEYVDRPHYWVEDVTIRIAPSLSVLGSRTVTASQPVAPSLLLIGNPTPPDASLAPLRAAGAEVQSIAREFDGRSKLIYEGRRATARAYLDSHPEAYSVIHFTAHALANKESPLDSAVVLSPSGRDYKLYARDILAHPIRADVVTLSSCRGAGARAYTGEGMVGFAWAFLRAGARNVVAGLWDVNDESTARLMETFYSEMKVRPPAQALRQAKLSMIRAGTPWSLPYYWGAFQIYTAAP